MEPPFSDTKLFENSLYFNDMKLEISKAKAAPAIDVRFLKTEF